MLASVQCPLETIALDFGLAKLIGHHFLSPHWGVIYLFFKF
jgi:hypothetical protein